MITHSLGGLVIIQSPSTRSIIVNLSVVPLRTVPSLLVHWIIARGLAPTVQLNVALSGDTTVRLVRGVLMTGTTVVNKTDLNCQ